MRVVDINQIGDRATQAPGEAWAVDPAARTDDPSRRDEDALATARAPGIRPQLVAQPGSIGELERRVARYLAAGAPSTVRICPAGHGYPLEPWAISPLPEYCEREGLALLVDPGRENGGYPWEAIVRLAQRHPRLVVVALAAPLWGPTAARALDAAPNLVLEASDVDGHPAVVDVAGLVRSCGPHRLAYGSGDPGTQPARVCQGLEPAAAEMVLSGTARCIDERAWARMWL